MNSIHVFSARAQMPTGNDLYEIYKSLILILVIDMTDGKIKECSIPMFWQMINDFVSDILVDKSIETDLHAIINEIEERMHTYSKRPLITCLQSIHEQYKQAKRNLT